VNILDENIVASQRERLRSWKIHFRRIGDEVGRMGMKDRDEIIPLLHRLRGQLFSPATMIFSRLTYAILDTAWFTLTWPLMKRLTYPSLLTARRFSHANAAHGKGCSHFS